MTHTPPGDTVITVTVDHLHRAFDAWETDFRNNVDGLRSATETAKESQDEIVSERVAAFLTYLEAAK